jgi:hypothetical protein
MKYEIGKKYIIYRNQQSPLILEYSGLSRNRNVLRMAVHIFSGYHISENHTKYTVFEATPLLEALL